MIISSDSFSRLSALPFRSEPFSAFLTSLTLFARALWFLECQIAEKYVFLMTKILCVYEFRQRSRHLGSDFRAGEGGVAAKGFSLHLVVALW